MSWGTALGLLGGAGLGYLAGGKKGALAGGIAGGAAGYGGLLDGLFSGGNMPGGIDMTNAPTGTSADIATAKPWGGQSAGLLGLSQPAWQNIGMAGKGISGVSDAYSKYKQAEMADEEIGLMRQAFRNQLAEQERQKDRQAMQESNISQGFAQSGLARNQLPSYY